jgi:hypothetical protein
MPTKARPSCRYLVSCPGEGCEVQIWLRAATGMSFADESEPMPACLSYLQVSAIQVELSRVFPGGGLRTS